MQGFVLSDRYLAQNPRSAPRGRPYRDCSRCTWLAHAGFGVNVPRSVGCRRVSVGGQRVVQKFGPVLGPTCSIARNLTPSRVRLFLVRDPTVTFASISGERSS